MMRLCINRLFISSSSWCGGHFGPVTRMCCNSPAGMWRETPNWIPLLQGENFRQTFCDRPLVVPPADTRHFLQVRRRGLTPRQNHHHFEANKKKREQKTHFVLMRKDTVGGGGKKRSCCGGFCRVFNASLVLRPHPNPSLLFTHTNTKSF